MLELSRADARRLLAAYQFAPGTLAEVFTRLGSVQFDPLNPVGRNPDLVLQARVPGYRVDDWEDAAYRDRLVYDGWDKQASLVLMDDWPRRRIYHGWHREWWRERVFEAHPEAVDAVLTELRARGPLTSTDFDFQAHREDWEGSWYGPKLTKHVLRALWHTGQVVTHGRRHGHHIYDLAERVVPDHLHGADPVSERESLEWLLLLRHRAVGLLRPQASTEVWSMNIPATERKAVVNDLVAEGRLMAVDVEGVRFHALPDFVETAGARSSPERMIFVAPLDQLMWDRKAVLHLYDFEYLWEVYVPEAKRRWGYYVLPVFYGERFVARFDSRFKGDTWQLYRWYWEEGVTRDADMLAALEDAVARFKTYLGADRVELPRGMDRATRRAWQAGGRT